MYLLWRDTKYIMSPPRTLLTLISKHHNLTAFYPGQNTITFLSKNVHFQSTYRRCFLPTAAAFAFDKR